MVLGQHLVLTNSTAGNPCNSQIRFTAESEHNEMRYILTIDIVVLCKDCIKRHYGRVHIKSESLDKYKNLLLNLSVQILRKVRPGSNDMRVRGEWTSWLSDSNENLPKAFQCKSLPPCITNSIENKFCQIC